MLNTPAIYLYAANCTQLDFAQALPLLTEDRIARIRKLRDDAGKQRSAAAGLLLRYAAKQLLDRFPGTVARGQTGKPYLPDHPEFHFSLSHSGDWAVCAAGFTPVGVDIQRIRPVSDTLKARFFSPEEQALCTDDETAIRLFCAHEAHGKMTGIGVSREPVHLVNGHLQIGALPVTEPFITKGSRVCLCAAGDFCLDASILTYEELLYKSCIIRV